MYQRDPVTNKWIYDENPNDYTERQLERAMAGYSSTPIYGTAACPLISTCFLGYVAKWAVSQVIRRLNGHVT